MSFPETSPHAAHGTQNLQEAQGTSQTPSHGLHLVISGRVQGVGYRFHLREQASAMGLHGWCRNRSDGTVEAEVSGPPDALDILLAWCRQGPPSSAVAEVVITPKPAALSADGFVIRPTEPC